MSYEQDLVTTEFADLNVADDEVLVVISNPAAGLSKSAQDLVEKSHLSLRDEYHYLSLHSGTLGEQGKKPYFVVEWKKEGNHSLERRWLLNKLQEKLKNFIKLTKVVVYLEAGVTSSELVMAEDIYFANMNALGEENRLDCFRVVAHTSCDLKELDPYRKVRLKYFTAYRRWMDENPDDLTSIEIGKRLASFAKEHNCEFTELDRDALQKEGMNLLLAVGQASTRSPSRLFTVAHNYDKNSKEKPVVLIGKGVTFDTGGINVKPFESFVNAMKNDMGGAALNSQLFMALVEAGYSKPLILVIPCCENLVAENSMKPGTVVKSHNGKRVFIEHTDAEGRLILADAISYVDKYFDPKLMVVAATLTTAVLKQFTNYFTAVHFAGDDFQKSLTASGDLWGERFTFWQEFLPFGAGNESSAADLTNMGRMPGDASIGGGSNVAAHFLKQFSTVPMVHFDIFASSWNWCRQYPGVSFGASGSPFNSVFGSLIRFCR